jgi:hypothetical protein
MNKLFSTGCWYYAIGLPIVQALIYWRFIVGPLSKHTCLLQMAFMNVIRWQSLLLFDSILLARYAMVVWLRNPSAVDDDFWCQSYKTFYVRNLRNSCNKLEC